MTTATQEGHIMAEQRELPELTTEVAWQLRGQMAGALAVLRDSGIWEASTSMQTADRLLSVGIKMAEEAAELIDAYTTIIGHERVLREQEA